MNISVINLNMHHRPEGASDRVAYGRLSRGIDCALSATHELEPHWKRAA